MRQSRAIFAFSWPGKNRGTCRHKTFLFEDINGRADQSRVGISSSGLCTIVGDCSLLGILGLNMTVWARWTALWASHWSHHWENLWKTPGVVLKARLLHVHKIDEALDIFAENLKSCQKIVWKCCMRDGCRDCWLLTKMQSNEYSKAVFSDV